MSNPLIPPPPLPSRDKPLWVFGYGSLLWNPGFPFVAHHKARLPGWARRFCIYSTHYRGTPEQPGLVLGLDQGDYCDGLLFHVAPQDANVALQYLWNREMMSGIYEPRWVPLQGPEGLVEACTFVVRRQHHFFADLSHEEQARIIATAHGKRGSNLEYLEKTVEKLLELDLPDPHLSGLLGLAAKLV